MVCETLMDAAAYALDAGMPVVGAAVGGAFDIAGAALGAAGDILDAAGVDDILTFVVNAFGRQHD